MEETEKLNTLFDAVAVKFLKDNNISCLPTDGNPLSELMNSMPFLNEDKVKYDSFQKN